MARTTRKRTAPTPAPASEAPRTGPGRYTAARFLSDCQPDTEQWLREQWAENNQLRSEQVPIDALPPVLMLACYAREYGVNVVDDYDMLLARYDSNISKFAHPDKFFSSCISILAERGLVPDDTSFETIKVPAIYEELFP